MTMIYKDEILGANKEEIIFYVKEFMNSYKYSKLGLNIYRPEISYGYIVNQQYCMLLIKLSFKQYDHKTKKETSIRHVGFYCDVDSTCTKISFPYELNDSSIIKNFDKILDKFSISFKMRKTFDTYGFIDSKTHK